MNQILIFVIISFILKYIFDFYVNWLNIKHLDNKIPFQFKEIFNPEKYVESQKYLRVRTVFLLIKRLIIMIYWSFLLILNGVSGIYRFVMGITSTEPYSGLLFLFVILFGYTLLLIPFEIYSQFKIEEDFGFNKMKIGIYWKIKIKSLLVYGSIFFGSLLGILSMFQTAGSLAWLYNWLITSFFMVFFIFVAPIIFVPLRFKYIPLNEGDLKTAINQYAKQQKYKLEGIYKIDTSKETSKDNAFFIGFGKLKRIVLYDNLIEKYTTDEIVAIVAHEVGHNKKKHILSNMLISIFSIGICFYIFNFLINNWDDLFFALSVPINNFPVGILILFLIFKYSPLWIIFSGVSNSISRKFEYQADYFSISTTNKAECLISALKKLNMNNYCNLTPHPLKISLDYTHPPVLIRISRIKE